MFGSLTTLQYSLYMWHLGIVNVTHVCHFYEVLPEGWGVGYMQTHNAQICDNGVPHLMEVTCSDYEVIFHRNKHFQKPNENKDLFKRKLHVCEGYFSETRIFVTYT